MLEQMHFLALHGEYIEIDLPGILSGRPDLVSEGLRWAIMHDQAELCFRLMDACTDYTDEQLYQSRSITCQMKPMDFFVWQGG
jgi:hypothetical protein